jgi:hypothetical protein
MVNEFLTDKEILEYLMTSDFNEGLTQDEFKFLLLKYKGYYRVIYTKNERMKYMIEELEDKLIKSEKDIISTKDEFTKNINILKKELEDEKNRKLTIRERILGKKINKLNGDKSV